MDSESEVILEGNNSRGVIIDLSLKFNGAPGDIQGNLTGISVIFFFIFDRENLT